MEKRIYVGNLPWDVTKARLEEIFSKFGEIEDAMVASDKRTRRSRGFGFVTFKNKEDAKKAIEEMNGKEVGRKILVKEAVPNNEERQDNDSENNSEEEIKQD